MKNYAIVAIFVIAVAALFMMPSGSMFNVDVRSDVDIEIGSRATVQTLWETRTLYTDSEKLDGVEVGDADNNGVTDLVTGGLSGVLTHIEYDTSSGKWVSETIWANPDKGEMLTPDIGDVNGDGKNEVVIGGMLSGPETDNDPGGIDMFWKEGGSWKREHLFSDTNLVHGLSIGDLDPDNDGNEIVGVGFSSKATIVWWDGTTWKNQTIFTDDGSIKKVIIDDYDPDHAGNEAVTVAKSKNLTSIYKDGGVWKSETLFTADAGLSRVAVGDLDPSSPGKEIISGADNGKVFLTKKSGSNWTTIEIFKETMSNEKNRGVWVGNFDPTHSGNELIVTGYSGNVTLVYGSGTSWVNRQLYSLPKDTGNGHRFHEARVGDFDPTSPGAEAVVVGYDARVTELYVSPWRGKALYKDPEKLDGVELGDADNDGKSEAVICGLGGTVTLVENDGSGWSGKVIWDNEARGELITPDIGDADPDKPGNEIIVGGMAAGPEADNGDGALTLIYNDGGVWKPEHIFTDTHLIHGNTIGDLDPDKPGNELIAVGFSKNVNLIWKEDGEWKSEVIFTADGSIKKVVVDDFDTEHPGNEAVIVAKSKNVTEIYKEDGVWKNRVLHTAGFGVSRVAVGELDQSSPGKEIVAGDDGGNAILLTGNGDSWESRILLTQTSKNRGVWIGDFNPDNDGNELVVTGYEPKVYMVWGSGATWNKKLIYETTDRLHDIRIGDYDPDHDGEEIAMVGYTNEITNIYYTGGTFAARDFEVSLTEDDAAYAIDPEGEIAVGFDVETASGFYEPVTVTVTGIPDYLEYTVFPTVLKPSASGEITITSMNYKETGNLTITVTAKSGAITKTTEFNLVVNKDEVAPTVAGTLYGLEAGEEKYMPESVYAQFVFSEPMTESTLSVQVTNEDGTKTYASSTEYFANNNTLKVYNLMDGTDPIPKGETFKIVVKSTAEDRGANTLAADSSLTFETVEEEKEDDELNWTTVGFLAALAILLLIIIVVLYLQSKKKKEGMDEEDEDEEEDEEEEEEPPKKKSGKRTGKTSSSKKSSSKKSRSGGKKNKKK